MQVSIVYASTNKAPMVSMYSRSSSTLISIILWQVTFCDRSWQTLIKIRHGSKFCYCVQIALLVHTCM